MCVPIPELVSVIALPNNASPLLSANEKLLAAFFIIKYSLFSSNGVGGSSVLSFTFVPGSNESVRAVNESVNVLTLSDDTPTVSLLPPKGTSEK